MLKKDDIKNIDLLVAKQKLHGLLTAILTDLQKVVEKNGYAVQTIQRFRGCLSIKQFDVSQLPFYSPTPFSHEATKISCVLCFVSCTIQMYHTWCSGDKEVQELLFNSVEHLGNIVVKGLDAFKIVGSKYPTGFYLEEINWCRISKKIRE